MLIIILLSVVFFAGCWTNTYRHTIFDESGNIKEIVQFSYAKAMTSSNLGTIDINLPDGANLHAANVIVIYDPNSWEYIGNGVSNGMTGMGNLKGIFKR